MLKYFGPSPDTSRLKWMAFSSWVPDHSGNSTGSYPWWTLQDALPSVETIDQATIAECFDFAALIIWGYKTELLAQMLPCLDHQSLAKYDELLKQGLQSIVNYSMTNHQWLQATLPIKEGGLGIRRVASLVSSAYKFWLKPRRPSDCRIAFWIFGIGRNSVRRLGARVHGIPQQHPADDRRFPTGQAKDLGSAPHWERPGRYHRHMQKASPIGPGWRQRSVVTQLIGLITLTD